MASPPVPVQNLQDISDALRRAFTLFPQFCLGQGLVELCYNQIKYDLARGFGVDAYASPFEMSFLGWIFVQLACQGSVLLLLRLLLHGDLLRWPRCVSPQPAAHGRVRAASRAALGSGRWVSPTAAA